MNFNEADKVVHPVETQWHYPILTQYGYVPDTLSDVGFVRSYMYTHPKTGHRMRLVTGSSADYWRDVATERGGYHSTLEKHLQDNA